MKPIKKLMLTVFPLVLAALTVPVHADVVYGPLHALTPVMLPYFFLAVLIIVIIILLFIISRIKKRNKKQ